MGSLIPWSRKHDPLEHTALLFFFFLVGEGDIFGGRGVGWARGSAPASLELAPCTLLFLRGNLLTMCAGPWVQITALLKGENDMRR